MSDAWLEAMKDAPAPRVDPDVWKQLDAHAAEAQSLLEQATQLDESGDRQEAAQLRERATALLSANDKARDYHLKLSRGWRETSDGRLIPPSAGAGERGGGMKGAPSFNDLIRRSARGED